MDLETAIANTGIAFDGRFATMMLVVFIAGIVRGFTGFGSALLAVPALAVIYGPVQAVVIEVLIEIPVCLGLLPTALKHAERRTILPMIAMFTLFVPVGAVLLTIINPDLVKIMISLFVLFAVALMWQQTRVARMISPKANYVVGAVSGITQGLTGMAGPLFATALIARGDNSIRTRANISALACGIILFSVTSFGILGLLTTEHALYALLASPGILLGVWVGSLLFRSYGDLKLREVILCVLAFTAAFTLLDTLR
ncbi:MAG: sulfite exporter TauE/SafE family protein [Pseudomonadota bacterium]